MTDNPANIEKALYLLDKMYGHLSKEEMMFKIAYLERGTIHRIKVYPMAYMKLSSLSLLEKIRPGLMHETLVEHKKDYISYLVSQTNGNPEYPILNTIRMINSLDNIVQVSNGEKFLYAPKKRVISELIKMNKSLMQEYIDKNGNKYDKVVLDNYKKYINDLENDREKMEDLENEITCELLNINHVIGSEEWSQKLIDCLKNREIWETS